MYVTIEKIEDTALSRLFPVEDQFLKEWFHSVIFSFERYGKLDLTPYENYAINYEFDQHTYQNKIRFVGNGGAVLTTEKMVIEYKKTKGSFSGKDIILIMKRNRYFR
ncbi:MAG: hypothetical protein WKF87_19070 [Chryseolinea sp.]